MRTEVFTLKALYFFLSLDSIEQFLRFFLVQRHILCICFHVCFWIAIQNQIGVFGRVTVDQPIHFRTRVVGGDYGTIGTFHFYAGGINVKLRAYNFFMLTSSLCVL